MPGAGLWVLRGTSVPSTGPGAGAARGFLKVAARAPCYGLPPPRAPPALGLRRVFPQHNVAPQRKLLSSLPIKDEPSAWHCRASQRPPPPPPQHACRTLSPLPGCAGPSQILRMLFPGLEPLSWWPAPNEPLLIPQDTAQMSRSACAPLAGLASPPPACRTPRNSSAALIFGAAPHST